jgi:hypothetical protein
MSDAANIRMVEANLPSVQAEINYSNGAGEPQPRRVSIRDGRPLVALREMSLDRSGFTQIAHRSVLHDFSHDATIRDIYYREAEALLRDVTGAEKIVVFDHTLRDSTQGTRRIAEREDPVRSVHNDHHADSAQRRVREHLPPEEAEARLRERFAIVNLWRPLGTVERLPLALCDARSVAAEDIVRAGDMLAFMPNAAHRWYWFPRLRPDEALLLKTFDSREEGVARFTAHTAFEDPNGSNEAPPRRSIELRALVFWQGR